MIKLTREELITAIRNQITMIAQEIASEDSGIYWCQQLAQKMNTKIEFLKRLSAQDPSTEFELVPIEYSEEDLNPDSMETCEVEIPDIGSDCNIPFFRGAPDGVGLKCVSHPDTEGPEYLKSVIKEHAADADRREEKIELLNKMIVDLERQHDADSKKWGEEVMLAHTEIDRLDKLILTSDIDRSYANERMREEEHKEYMAARDEICELKAQIKQLQKYYDYAKTYIPQQKINKRFVTHDEPCSTNSPTSGG